VILKLHDFVSRVRVPAGFLLAVFYFCAADPSWLSLEIGASIAFVGLMVRAWAAGYLQKNARLAVLGPYALTRNPLYFGTFLIGAGFSLASRDLRIFVVFLGSFAVLYGSAMQREIKILKNLFGEQYCAYQEQVPLFFPRLRLEKQMGDLSFERYLNNREYQALIGFFAALILLVAKVYYFHNGG